MGNHGPLNLTNAWIQTLLTTFFSALTVYTIFEMRDEARDLYKETSREKSRVKDFEWLKARTIHVRGLLPKDRRGDLLRNEMDALLEPIKGRVLDVIVTPDFSRLFDLETEKKELEDLHHLVSAHGTP